MVTDMAFEMTEAYREIRTNDMDALTAWKDISDFLVKICVAKSKKRQGSRRAPFLLIGSACT